MLLLLSVHSLDELQDYICVSQHKYNGDCRAVLFVKMRQGLKLTPEIKAKIEKKVDEELWEDCVPELILEIPDIPVRQIETFYLLIFNFTYCAFKNTTILLY